MTMEATLVKMGTSLGFKVPETVIKDFNLKEGTKIEINFLLNGKSFFREKSKKREGWNAAFAQYALEGEDKLMLPDFLDLETEALM
jgi:antitoxin component of MazEF toxin-antitoxin module